MLRYKDQMTLALFARWLRDGADADYTEVAWALRYGAGASRDDTARVTAARAATTRR